MTKGIGCYGHWLLYLVRSANLSSLFSSKAIHEKALTLHQYIWQWTEYHAEAFKKEAYFFPLSCQLAWGKICEDIDVA